MEKSNNFDSIYVMGLLYRHKLLIALVVLASALISVGVSLMMPNWYTSTLNAVPPQSSTSGLESAMGNLSSTLKDIGLSKIGGSGSESYSLKVILDSKSVKDSMISRFNLRKRYDLSKEPYENVLQEYDANFYVSYEKEGNYIISATDKDPKFATDMANAFIGIANHFASIIYKREQTLNRLYMEKRLASIDSSINSITTALGELTESSLMFSPEEQARAISSGLVDLKSQVYQSEIEYDMYKNTYGEKDPVTLLKKNLLDKTKEKLDEAMKKPGFAGNFKLDQSGKIGIDYMMKFTEIEALSKAKSYLWPLLEKAKLDETKNLQTLLVLDSASVPDKKSKPKRSLIVLGSTFGSFVLTILLILLVYSYKDFKRKLGEISL